MNGSRVAKVATVAVLTVIFLGGTFAASGLQNPFDETTSSFTVPVGNYGDHAEYELNHGSAGDPEAGRIAFSWDFHGPGMSIDKYGDARTVANIDVGISGGDFGGWPLKTSFDVNTREVIRYEERYIRQNTDLLLPYTITESGVFLGPLVRGYAHHEMHRFAAHVQGLTFQDGEDLSTRIGFLGTGRDDVQGEEFAQSIHVIGMADLNGEPVWGVQVNVQESETNFRGSNGIDMTEQEWSNVTFWFSERSPVPLRMDFEEAGRLVQQTPDAEPESWHDSGYAVLTSFRSGSNQIPWGVPSVSLSKTRVLSPASGDYPRSGTEWRGAYRLEDAITAVETDSTLVDFTNWKQENPGARLVGFFGHPARIAVQGPSGVPLRPVDPFGDDVHTWNLRYAAPFGATTMLIESYRSNGGQIVNRIPQANGEPVSEPARFNPAWMPASFVELHAADVFFQALVDAATYDLGPNYAWWGYAHPNMTNPGPSLKQIIYGRIADDKPYAGIAARPVAGVAMHADTGEYLGGVGGLFSPNFTPQIGTPAEDARPELAAGKTKSNLIPIAAAAASASLLLLVAIYVLPFIQQGAVGLYTKLVKNQLLDHALRDHLVILIRENPGISAPALKGITGSGWSTIVYHLSVLTDNSLVTSFRDGRHRRYFVVGATNHSSMREMAVLRNGRTRQVYDLLNSQPGIERAAVSALIGLGRRATVWHLERLIGAEIVRVEKRGRAFGYFPVRPQSAHEIGISSTHVLAIDENSGG